MGLSLISGTSRAFFVHGSLGSDGNPGTAKDPLKTITAAYGLCTSGAGDTVYVLNDGTTSATVRDAALVWAKNNTHLVGLCAPTLVNQRARISPPTTITDDVDAYTPYLTLSGSGCVISNISWFQGNSEDSKASVGVKVTGSRNVLKNVAIITGAHANQGDEATYQLQVTGSENTFEDCYIGQDTAAAGNNAAYANLRFGSGAGDEATRNVFRRCIFPMFADDTEPAFVRVVGLTDIQRWNLFEDCVFINTGTSTLDAAVVSPGSVTGKLFFKDCAFYGMTNVTAADSTDVLLYGISGASVVDVGFFKGVDIA
jgi:hypothetical protein